MIAVGDTVFLWVHDTEPGSNGAGLAGRARVGNVDYRGQDDVNITVEHVELCKPLRMKEFEYQDGARSRVGKMLINLPHRQSLYIAQSDVAEWEDHYRSLDEIFAGRAVAYSRSELEQENLERFSQEPAENKDRFAETPQRPGQAAFREKVLRLHEGRCAVTQENVASALEAAHVLSWAKNKRLRDDPRNGIALRADLHRLFDRGLVWVDDDKLVLAPELRGSVYEVLHNKPVATTASPSHLEQHSSDARKRHTAP